MTLKELIQQSKKTINGKLHFDYASRWYKSPVFKQKKSKISDDDITRIQKDLTELGIHSHVEKTKNKYYLKVLRGKPGKKRIGWFYNLVLLLLTILTTTFTGALFLGKDPFLSYENITSGYRYSFALLTILLIHEMGHFLAARFYKVRATLPYFVPLFLPAFHPGTMGAFIKMRSAIPSKRALFDVGVAGPLAGFIASLTFLSIGFAQLPGVAGVEQYIAQIHPPGENNGINLVLGHTFMYDLLAYIFNGQHLGMNEIYHFPYIFAGWIGLLVTALNLMPIGQLDGGHLTYALFGDRARKVALAAFGLLILLNLYLMSNYNSYVWVMWPIIILVFIRFRHPPTMDDIQELGVPRKILGLLSLVIFILCFSPLPVYLN